MSASHVLTILAVADLERAVSFYEAGFGWPRNLTAPGYVELALPGGTRLGLYAREGFGRNTGQLPAQHAPGSLAPVELYFHVDDPEAAALRLLAAGARQLSALAPRDWGDRAAYFADPDGNVLVVARPLAAAVTAPASERSRISSGSPFEPRIGFSRAVRVGRQVAVSGTAPIGDDGNPVCIGSAYGQARRCLEIAGRALESAGASLDRVIRTRVMMRRAEDWAEVARAHAEVFGEIRPASTFVQVAGFIDPDWLVEIELDAVI